MIYFFCILNTFIKSKLDTENLSIPSRSIYPYVREEISKEKPSVTERVIQDELTLFGINIE